MNRLERSLRKKFCVIHSFTTSFPLVPCDLGCFVERTTSTFHTTEARGIHPSAAACRMTHELPIVAIITHHGFFASFFSSRGPCVCDVFTPPTVPTEAVRVTTLTVFWRVVGYTGTDTSFFFMTSDISIAQKISKTAGPQGHRRPQFTSHHINM